MGAVSTAVSVMDTVITLPVTLGVPKVAVVLVELKLPVAPEMALPLESLSVAVTVTELPATTGLGETATVELAVETGSAETESVLVPEPVVKLLSAAMVAVMVWPPTESVEVL
jgi:hypothetical protein